MRLPVPKLFASRKNFGYGALVTMNFKINEVDKSGIIRINKRFKERKTKSTLTKDLLTERAFW